jgi:putative MATE family efflux protein
VNQAPDNPLLRGPVVPTILRLSLPNGLGAIASALMAMADVAFVSASGNASLAAMAFVYPFVMLQSMMSTGAMGGGVASAIARAIGANDLARARELARHACVIALLGAGLYFLLFKLLGPTVFSALGASAEVLERSIAYSDAVFIGSLSVWLTNTFLSIIRGGGNMKVPSLVFVGIGVLQISFCGLFSLGFGGFKGYGIAGVGYGQALAYTVSAIYLLWYLQAGKARIRLQAAGARFRWSLFKDILKVGGVACISPVFTVLTIQLVNRLVNRLGTEALAGYGISSRLEFLLIPVAFAIGTACVPIVGMAIGAGDIARARKITWAGGAISAFLMGLIGVFFAIWPSVWVNHYTSDPQVAAMASAYLVWVGPSYILFGWGMGLYFASMGSGRIMGPALVTAVRFLVLALGGWALLRSDAPAWAMFALVGVAMCAYGLAVALSVKMSDWSKS